MRSFITRIGCLAPFAGLALLIPAFSVSDGWSRDLTKNERWHTDVVEDEEYTDEVETGRRVGRRRSSDSRTAEQPADAGPSVLSAEEPAGKATPGTPETVDPANAPSVVAPPKGEEGAAEPDPRRDNLEAAREMLEKQLDRLRKAREARDKGTEGAVVAPEGKEAAQLQTPNPVRDVITLYIDPLEARPEPGSRFVSTVELENHARKEFDEVGFVLRYNTKTLRVIDGDQTLDGINIHDQSFRDEFPWERSEDYMNIVDDGNGLVTYRAKWRDGTPLSGAGTIASVTFEVVGETDSGLGFVFWDDSASGSAVGDVSPLTYVRLANSDVLGRTSVPDDGTLDGTVKFYEHPKEASAAGPTAPDGQDLLTRILIYPSVPAVTSGDEFDYVIAIDNPDRVEFDEVTLVLGYNTSHLAALDHDRGNYIRKGVNVFDGEFHQTFPFNHHHRNEIDVRRGVILYRMGTLRTLLNSSGILASVRFRALSPTGEQGTRLKVGFVKDTIESGLTRRRVDVLADPTEWNDGFEVYPVRILPSGVSRR